MANFLVVLAACFSVLTSLVAITVVITKLRSNVNALKDQEKRIDRKNEEGAATLNALLIRFEGFIREQGVINAGVAAALDRVATRCDNCRDEAAKQNGVMVLLSEVLKHKQIVDIG